jgi:hypothetical protein
LLRSWCRACGMAGSTEHSMALFGGTTRAGIVTIIGLLMLAGSSEAFFLRQAALRHEPSLRFQALRAVGSSPVVAEDEEVDVVVVGSGLGGLCCAALIASRGYKVTWCMSA